jgi:hypothetical protein
LPISIHHYGPEHEGAVREFNQRLQSAGAESNLVFYETAQPKWLPRSGNASALYNEFFVALDGGVVRGGYALKHQDFSFPDGAVRNIAYYHHPLSEGIVNKSYAVVGGLLLRDAMQRSPLLYCLGMGGYENPLPKLLVRQGWSHCLAPFYFRVVHATRFLREMESVRSSGLRGFAADMAAYTGAGWAAAKMFNLYRQLQRPQTPQFEVDPIAEFDAWADDLWERTRGVCGFTAVRDAASLRTLYPASERHLTRLRISRNAAAIGWAVVGEKRTDAKYGSLRVGSIVDCWCDPSDALAIILAATETLEKAGVDLIVSNQTHKSWCAALHNAGFLSGPSNFIFAASKKLGELLQPFDEAKVRMHLTRADGDGLPRNF